MSLPAPTLDAVPPDTLRVARASFPKGTLAMNLRDHLGSVYEDDLFASLFSPLGQPAVPPWRLVLVSILQFVEGLTDRQAADAVRGRLDWKYALGLELTDPGFHYSVLSEFRARLIAGDVAQTLLDTLLTRCQQRGWLKAGGTQRTDATHVLGAVRAMNRLESVGETLRAALNALAVAAPDWLHGQITADWWDHYSRRVEEYRLPKGDAARQVYANTIGTDGTQLLAAIYAPTAPDWLRQLPAVELLRRMWVQQYYAPDADGAVRQRSAKDVPPGALWIHSPYDGEVRYGTKRSTTWVGFKVHLTETCDPLTPHLITQVQTTSALAGDNTQVAAIQTELGAKGLAPQTHLVAAGYTSAEEFVQSKERGIVLVGPIREATNWQAREGQGYDLSAFAIDWEQQRVTCPNGKHNSQWKQHTDRSGRRLIQALFRKADCLPCPVRAMCTRSKNAPRQVTFQPQIAQEALQAARSAQHTAAFKEVIAARAGVEGTMSQGVRALELRQSRYIGLEKTHLQHIWIALALNVLRLVAWLGGREIPPRRRAYRTSLRWIQGVL